MAQARSCPVGRAAEPSPRSTPPPSASVSERAWRPRSLRRTAGSSTGTTEAFAELTRTGAGVTAYTDSSVAVGTTYCYRVRAFNAVGYSDYSDVACATVAQPFSLAVVKAGVGSGTVTSEPTGISCGTTCSSTSPVGTTVTLTATPAHGSTFSGWG